MKKLLIIIGITAGLNTSIVAGPIHDAAKIGVLVGVQAELDKGVDVNVKGSHEETPLHWAAGGGHKEIVELLVNNGADVNAKNKWGGTPLHWAPVGGNKEVVEFLIEKGANVNEKRPDGMTPLWVAVSKSYKEIIWLLIDKGADINVKDNEGNSPLHNSLIDKEIAELLIGKGADVTALNNSGESVLWEQRRTEIIEYLIGEGVNVNAKDKHGKSIVDLWERDEDYNGEMAALLRSHGGRSIVDELHYSVKDLNERVTALEKSSTNPTNEWPRKMWEIDLGKQIGNIDHYIGLNNSILLIDDNVDSYWITQDGKSFRIKNTRIDKDSLLYLDNKNLIYKWRVNNVDKVILLSRNKELVLYNEANPINIQFRWSEFNSSFNSPIGVSQFGTKITAWDFTPPTNTAPDLDGGNNGGNETANSRLIIKTSGPDIALATDGKLGGAAELQKSNDLRSWRKLSDVPEEASEVLVTPRESGNEFYRLKKK